MMHDVVTLHILPPPSHPRLMLLVVLLVPFLLPSTSGLGLNLDVNPETPSANSSINIEWTVQNASATPDNFTLYLYYPLNTSEVKSTDVMINGQLSGSEEMSVGPVGSYSIEVVG